MNKPQNTARKNQGAQHQHAKNAHAKNSGGNHSQGHNQGQKQNNNPIFESHTPEGKTQKGNAKQLYEHYKGKAANVREDEILSMQFAQYADHYYRVYQKNQQERLEKGAKSQGKKAQNNGGSAQKGEVAEGKNVSDKGGGQTVAVHTASGLLAKEEGRSKGGTDASVKEGKKPRKSVEGKKKPLKDENIVASA